MRASGLYSWRIFLSTALAAWCLFVAGCGGGGGTEAGNPTLMNNESFTAYLKMQIASNLTDSGASITETGTVLTSAPTSATTGAASGDSGQAATAFTSTNVQEAGVDEADTVKTDGTYLYVGSGSKFTIVRAVPRDKPVVVSSQQIDGVIDSIYLYKNIAVLLYHPKGTDWASWDRSNFPLGVPVGMPTWIPANSRVGVILLDVSDPANPVRLRDFSAEGSMVSSRLVAGTLRVVLQFAPALPPLNQVFSGVTNDYDAKVQENLARLKDLTLADLTPSYRMTDRNGQQVTDQQLVALNDYYIPGKPCGGSIVAVVGFDLNAPQGPFTSTGIVADAQAVYASPTTMYVTNFHVPDWSSAGASLIETRILKFDITAPKAAFRAMGAVPGRIINQFSLSEFEEVLRIATTSGFPLKSQVSCLKEQNGELVKIGSVDNIAPGENLYAVRFIGKRGYVVTFVQVDPLFTLDLADPTNPTIAGQLKVPGYSTYLHPLGDNYLLAIGKDMKTVTNTITLTNPATTPSTITVSTGTSTYYQGLQLSIFDISTFSAPKLLFSQTIGDRGTDSDALRDHKAFTYWADQGLLALPVYLYEHLTPPAFPYSSGTHTFNGVYVYRVSAQSGFAFLGRMSTAPASTTPAWTRGLFIGDGVYGVDGDSVGNAAIADIANTQVDLPF
jgi:inhibitor of cysteine peptidase